MSLANINSKEKEELKEIPIGIKWEWDDSKKCLSYKNNVLINEKSDKKNKTKGGKIDLRCGAPRLITQTRQKINEPTKSEAKKQINSIVSITDVKNAALFMLSERYFIPHEFENYCNDGESKVILEKFLLHLANYFYWYFESIDSLKITNEMCIERSQSDKNRILKANTMLKKTLKVLAKWYCMLILGLGSDEYHHMNCGKKRVSCGFRDRGLFETLYPFCTFFIWINFRRRDYELIRQEIGRILRSDSFNSPFKVESILDEENNLYEKSRDKNIILNNFEENKKQLSEFTSKITTSRANLTQRSPVLVSILPSTVENSKWLYERRGENINNLSNHEEDENEEIELFTEVGIIGQPMKLFHVKTLASRGNEDGTDEGIGELKIDDTEGHHDIKVSESNNHNENEETQ